MENYKEEIIATRLGCLGGSDGKLIQQVASLGYVPKSAYKRMASCKGLIENESRPTTVEMRFGDFVEQSLYEHLCSGSNKKYESNPLWKSLKFSRSNVKLICHPDIVHYDYDNRVLYIYEVKATKFDITQTKGNYRQQMFIEYMLGTEVARALGKTWKVRVFLAHYDTNGLDINEDSWEFDSKRITISRMAFGILFDIAKSMDIIDAFLENMTEYYDGDEIESQYLPTAIKDEFDKVTQTLIEIKERELTITAFKEKLYAFMKEKDIKSIKNDAWSITRVDDTESKTFDHKKYIQDQMVIHPYKTKKIVEQYTKVTNRKGYVNIKLKKEK